MFVDLAILFRGAAGAIHRVLALRHNAFESHLAGVGEDGRAVPFQMLVEAQAKASFGQRASKRGLAHFQGITPHVVAVALAASSSAHVLLVREMLDKATSASSNRKTKIEVRTPMR